MNARWGSTSGVAATPVAYRPFCAFYFDRQRAPKFGHFRERITYREFCDSPGKMGASVTSTKEGVDLSRGITASTT